MGRITRRSVIGCALTGALVSVTAAPVPLLAATKVRAPDRPMRLTRKLERGMRGGAVLMVEREWLVSFAAQGRGFAITGDQTSANVDAPKELAPLAQIESSRSTQDMFPIVLDPNGTIAMTGVYTRAGDLEAAVARAEAIIAERAIPSGAKALQLRYLAQLQRASASLLNHMPSDLFFPSTEFSHAKKPVTLPDGLVGEFEVQYEAQRAPEQQWLSRAVREVITRIGASERRSREVWSMAAT